MEQQDGNWDKNFIVTLIGLIVAIVALVVAVTTPEVRNFFGLQDDEPTPVVQETPSPTEYTLAEHERQFIKEANTELSFSFNSIDGVSIVSLIISPVGKTPITRAMLNGRSYEFTSLSGVFLVTVLDIDWEGKTVAVQVSRKL